MCWEKDLRRGSMPLQKKEYETLYELMENDWDSIHGGKQHLFTEGGKLEDRADSKTTWCCTEKTYKQFLAADGVKMPCF